MSVETIKVSRKFEKAYRKLPSDIKATTEKKENIFRINPFDSRLDTHKLHGKDSNLWAFSVTSSYRIKFVFLNNNSVLFLEIGTHNIYK